MILTAHQPAYLPWLGYLDKIAKADVFIFLDTVQYEKNSFINRNRIKTAQGPQWLTIPVRTKGHMSATLRDTQIEARYPWHRKHLKSIAMNYSRAAFFREKSESLWRLFADLDTSLADFCFVQLKFWLEEFGIHTRVVRSSELTLSAAKSDLILELCTLFGADRYISGARGCDYLAEDDFRAAGIEIETQDFSCPIYPQRWGPFIPNLSVVDYWLNCGAGGLSFGKER